MLVDMQSQSARQRLPRNPCEPRDGSRDEMMRDREKRRERSVWCVRAVIDTESTVEDRLAADHASVDDRRLANRERLRHR